MPTRAARVSRAAHPPVVEKLELSFFDPVVWNLIGARKYSPDRILPELVYSTRPFWPVSLARGPIAVRAITSPREPVSISTVLSAPSATDTARCSPEDRAWVIRGGILLIASNGSGPGHQRQAGQPDLSAGC